MKRKIAAVAGTFVFLSCAAATPAQEGSKPARRDIERTFPAEKLDTLRVDAHVGDVVLTGSGERVVLRLHIEAKLKSSGIFRRERWGDPAGVELTADTSGGELRLSLRGEREGLEEHWTIEAPARLAARLKVSVGRIEVEGMAGGCDLHVNVGDVNARVLGGNIEAEANVGSVRVETSTPSYGNIEVEANVGDISVDLSDHKVRTPNRPARATTSAWTGPAATASG
jgi:hypothetical protein